VLDRLLFVAGLTGADALDQARRIFAAAGTDLSHVVRALFFHAPGAELRDPGFPFTALAVEGGLTVDLWGHVP
jgi:hypothetical protein